MNLSEKASWLKNFSESELYNDILPFWRNHTVDEQNGGFYGEISHSMQIVKDSPKGLILHARILWTFSAAWQLTKNETDKKLAERAYNYLCSNFFDNEFGGFFWSVTSDGKPLDTKKQIYAQAFTIYGLSEYYKITKDDNVLQKAIDLFYLIEKHAFDDVLNGYIDAYSRDWSDMGDIRLSAKDMNEKKTMNTHLHIVEAYANLYLVWKNNSLAEKLENLVRIFLDIIISSSDYHLNLFFDEKWNSKSTAISYGHDIEAGWLVHESALVHGSKELIKEVEAVVTKITDAALEGLTELGGLYHESDRAGKHVDTELEWWPQAEAMVGLINSYQVNGNSKYIDIAYQIGLFIDKYMIDKKNGEWYYRVDKNGKPIESYVKTGFWKCPYHNGRACIEIIKRVEELKLPVNEK
jgi:mannobiose 2-epimerase